jgi:hypothetical protein
VVRNFALRSSIEQWAAEHGLQLRSVPAVDRRCEATGDGGYSDGTGGRAAAWQDTGASSSMAASPRAASSAAGFASSASGRHDSLVTGSVEADVFSSTSSTDQGRSSSRLADAKAPGLPGSSTANAGSQQQSGGKEAAASSYSSRPACGQRFSSGNSAGKGSGPFAATYAQQGPLRSECCRCTRTRWAVVLIVMVIAAAAGVGLGVGLWAKQPGTGRAYPVSSQGGGKAGGSTGVRIEGTPGSRGGTGQQDAYIVSCCVAALPQLVIHQCSEWWPECFGQGC